MTIGSSLRTQRDMLGEAISFFLPCNKSGLLPPRFARGNGRFTPRNDKRIALQYRFGLLLDEQLNRYFIIGILIPCRLAASMASG